MSIVSAATLAKEVLGIGKSITDLVKRKNKKKPITLPRTPHMVKPPVSRPLRERSTPMVGVATDFKRKTNHPRIVSKNGVTTYIHREYIQDVSTSNTTNAFSVYEWEVNPGNASMFPWLSTEALGFSLFTPKRITYEVRSMVATTTNGSCFGAVTGDPVIATPTSKADMLAFEDSARCNLWSNFVLDVPQSILTRLPRYIVTGNTAEADSTRSVGQLFIGSSGASADTEFGELYVSYEIDFYNPTPYVSTSTQAVINSTAYNNSLLLSSYSGNINLANLTNNNVASDYYIAISHQGSLLLSLTTVGISIVNPGVLTFIDSWGVVVPSTLIINITGTSLNIATQSYTIVNAPNPMYMYYTTSVNATSLTSRAMIVTLLSPANEYKMVSTRVQGVRKEVTHLKGPPSLEPISVDTDDDSVHVHVPPSSPCCPPHRLQSRSTK